MLVAALLAAVLWIGLPIAIFVVVRRVLGAIERRSGRKSHHGAND
jgi:hypothetical protein